MNKRQTFAVSDADGNISWFPIAEAQGWAGTTLQDGDLFRAADRWVLLDADAALLGGPGRILDDDAALSWLVVNGYAPPAELAECAARRKLRPVE